MMVGVIGIQGSKRILDFGQRLFALSMIRLCADRQFGYPSRDPQPAVLPV